jgi:hypothetical protein
MHRAVEATDLERRLDKVEKMLLRATYPPTAPKSREEAFP